ncbi:E3 ubiquitin-protein ligase XBAT33-like [Dioscorea cayenensis subsp. rotundata]|uniref:E3 ubiquitin-protein ligase XBAT33-like n=1 Tax=Dioscorea cayennensis subsp. rotundata TaxID=55577 RepID=A0AB40B9P3_DIOCR|nr:E3 ubiquitin-protein ligase XBAT33-like [Dioscorea cayenensis subsp. rotundata]
MPPAHRHRSYILRKRAFLGKRVLKQREESLGRRGMGNSLGCSASGERLVSAARDGDLTEARMILEFNPSLTKYSTFSGLNSPLHFVVAKGHCEIVTLLLENGADVNSRNYCDQTALMQACRNGHWEVVQTLLLYRK